MASARSTFRSAGVAVRLTLVATVVLGVAYPLAVWGVGQVGVPRPGQRLDGHGLVRQGRRLLVDRAVVHGQAGRPLVPVPAVRRRRGRLRRGRLVRLEPRAEQRRPAKAVEERRAAVAKADGVSAADVPADAVTASGSGLDPDISPAYASQQVARVASARGLSRDAVRRWSARTPSRGSSAFLGEPAVNVLELNLALAKAVLTRGCPSAKHRCSRVEHRAIRGATGEHRCFADDATHHARERMST